MVFEWLDLASFVLMLLPNKGLSESKILKDARGKSAAPYNPAPYAFSIWGVIWAINIWFLVEQVINGSKLPTSLHILYIVTNLLQGGWSVSVQRNKKGQSIFFIQSELPMLFIAANIITQTSSVPLSAYLAFMLWFSWISIATTISLFEFLSRKYNIPFFESTLWSLVLISYASVLSSYFLLNRSAAAYTAVTIWGLLGIFNAKVNSRPPIRYYALLMAGVLSLLIAKQKLGF